MCPYAPVSNRLRACSSMTDLCHRDEPDWSNQRRKSAYHSKVTTTLLRLKTGETDLDTSI